MAQMPDFAYTLNPASIPKFLKEIHAISKPPKLTIKVLEGLGYKSKNDRNLISILKALDFIDGSGVPTERWQQYRDATRHRAVLASAIRGAYSELFALYPDADRKDDEALRNFFRAHTNLGARALGAVVSTFKTLCELADFEASPGEEAPEEALDVSVATPRVKVQTPLVPVINVNVELQIPATDDPSVYEKFFEALKKHLLR
jgi:hypothetical protein